MSIPYSDISAAASMLFPIQITNIKTGKLFVAGSLAASSAYIALLGATVAGTVGGIPYAIESASSAPKGNRFRHAVAGLKTEGLASARFYGAVGLSFPVGVYIGEKMGLKDDSIAKKAVIITSAAAVTWGLHSNVRRWYPKGSILSVVASTILVIGGLNFNGSVFGAYSHIEILLLYVYKKLKRSL